jgi:hypothetical protein
VLVAKVSIYRVTCHASNGGRFNSLSRDNDDPGRQRQEPKKLRHRKDIYQRIFISYPISKNLQQRKFPILFWSRIFWGYNILFLGISKYRIHILSYILFSTFSARDFGFQRQDFSFSTAVSAISSVIWHFLAALLIDQGFNSIRLTVEDLCAAVLPGLAFCCLRLSAKLRASGIGMTIFPTHLPTHPPICNINF